MERLKYSCPLLCIFPRAISLCEIAQDVHKCKHFKLEAHWWNFWEKWSNWANSRSVSDSLVLHRVVKYISPQQNWAHRFGLWYNQGPKHARKLQQQLSCLHLQQACHLIPQQNKWVVNLQPQTIIPVGQVISSYTDSERNAAFSRQSTCHQWRGLECMECKYLGPEQHHVVSRR